MRLAKKSGCDDLSMGSVGNGDGIDAAEDPAGDSRGGTPREGRVPFGAESGAATAATWTVAEQ